MEKSDDDRFREQLPPITRSLLGIAKGVTEEDYYRYLEEKYGCGSDEEKPQPDPPK
jgi:hypothetical protein